MLNREFIEVSRLFRDPVSISECCFLENRQNRELQ